jgi:hypothetical protein
VWVLGIETILMGFLGWLQEEAEYACVKGSHCCDPPPKGEDQDEEFADKMAPTLEDRIRWYTEDNHDLTVRTLEEDIRESMDFTEEQVISLPNNGSIRACIRGDWFWGFCL